MTPEQKQKLVDNLKIAREKKQKMIAAGTYKKKTTKLREQAEQEFREKYTNIIAPYFKKISTIQMEEALKPENKEERKYVLDQFIGKPAEVKKIDVKPTQLKEISDNIKSLASPDKVSDVPVGVNDAAEGQTSGKEDIVDVSEDKKVVEGDPKYDEELEGY